MASNQVIYESFDLAPEEKKALKETGYFDSLAHSPGWQKLKAFGQSLVDEAQQDMSGNLSNDPVSYMRLQIRWQQRLSMMLALIQYVDQMVAERRELIERATEETDEYDRTS